VFGVKLFIPSVQTFAVSDTIPFFLQLRASTATLKAFMSYTSTKRSSENRDSRTPASYVFKAKPSVRVLLYRQIRAEINEQRAWRTTVLGEGKLSAFTETGAFLSSSDDSVESLEWEGGVRCNEDVTVGSFSVGKLVVKDFIMLALIPPNPLQSSLLQHQHAHPIRLVTDRYIDMVMPG